ncbi:hypothetical protein [Streptomyces sp. LN704]|uniref:hypothetical protein n=1 Tax=Streptomyces sp. LN704 TaxID=3112982 RepID=UPI003717B036
MNDVMPEGEALRLFTVPITDSFAREAVSILARFRELTDEAMRVKETDAFDQNTTSLFRREATEIEALSDPLRSARSGLHAMIVDTADLTKDTLWTMSGPWNTTS